MKKKRKILVDIDVITVAKWDREKEINLLLKKNKMKVIRIAVPSDV
ncbi:MAG: hypothetical protein HYT73_02155 [Candidatus Aenigmarchaeota archaeon]|nr:hypothetical protein [Candidatus Aenigmarchaeota archaeon]